MKNLENFIKTLESATNDSAIESEGQYLLQDSIYYLNEYKNKIEKFKDYESALIISKMLNVSINLPLSWEQLKQLKKRPVWVVSGENGEHRRWFIIDRINNNRMCMVINKEKKTYMKEGMGKYWNAYVKER